MKRDQQKRTSLLNSSIPPTTEIKTTIKNKLSVKIRNIFLAGLAVLIPVIITIFIIRVLISWSDSLLGMLPSIINPHT
jgi:hypothetical protein